VLIGIGLYLAASIAIAAWMLPAGTEPPPISFATPRAKQVWPLSAAAPEAARSDALRRASVWIASDPASADLASNPPDPSGALSGSLVRCRYLDEPARGTTAKFDCVLADGEVVKVKYGQTGEIQAEIAATRLNAKTVGGHFASRDLGLHDLPIVGLAKEREEGEVEEVKPVAQIIDETMRAAKRTSLRRPPALRRDRLAAALPTPATASRRRCSARASGRRSSRRFRRSDRARRSTRAGPERTPATCGRHRSSAGLTCPP
jgi:hypothetical protein